MDNPVDIWHTRHRTKTKKKKIKSNTENEKDEQHGSPSNSGADLRYSRLRTYSG